MPSFTALPKTRVRLGTSAIRKLSDIDSAILRTRSRPKGGCCCALYPLESADAIWAGQFLLVEVRESIEETNESYAPSDKRKEG